MVSQSELVLPSNASFYRKIRKPTLRMFLKIVDEYGPT